MKRAEQRQVGLTGISRNNGVSAHVHRYRGCRYAVAIARLRPSEISRIDQSGERRVDFSHKGDLASLDICGLECAGSRGEIEGLRGPGGINVARRIQVDL